jgi:hypothetical protein
MSCQHSNRESNFGNATSAKKTDAFGEISFSPQARADQCCVTRIIASQALTFSEAANLKPNIRLLDL